MPSRRERGDWQTPLELAREVVGLALRQGARPSSVIEPTCGRGAFLQAAAEAFPDARLFGFDLEAAHIDEARRALSLHAARTELVCADFFRTDWEAVLGAAPGPTLLLGNPPWVTSAGLGAIGSANHPPKRNDKRLSGLRAKTGDANFDISEWMLTRLIDAARACSRPLSLLMLCKASVARKVMEHTARLALDVEGSVRTLDARRWFDVAVDAVVLSVARRSSRAVSERARPWSVFTSLEATGAARQMGLDGCGRLVSDLSAFEATRALEGSSEIEWRSGLKHDCAPVMELHAEGRTLKNGLGEALSLEDELVFPLRKGSHIANARTDLARRVLVTQRHLGEDTQRLERALPASWAYLMRHKQRFEARRSSIYRGQPPFAMFGVGPYAFAPWKVAICGLYKRLHFEVVGPVAGKPTMLDDTSYFLPCADEPQARALADALNGPRARAFFEARLFWDEKRPIRKQLLQSLSLSALLGRPLPQRAS